MRCPFVYLAAALPLAIFIGLIPVTISGMGTRDTAMIVLLKNMQPTKPIGGEFSLHLRLLAAHLTRLTIHESSL